MSIFDRLRPPTLDVWVARLGNGTPEQRARAVDALVALGADAVVPAVQAALTAGVTPAAEVLRRLHATDALCACAREGEGLAPQAAVAALVALHAEASVRDLIGSGPLQTRQLALRQHVARWGPGVLEDVGEDPDLASAVADERALLGPPPQDRRSFEELLPLLGQESGLAIGAMSRLDDPRVNEVLIGLLQRPRLIGPVALALASRNAKEALPALRAAESSGLTPAPVMPSDGDPREMLAAAIRRLAG